MQNTHRRNRFMAGGTIKEAGTIKGLKSLAAADGA